MRSRIMVAFAVLSLSAATAHAEGFLDPHIRANLGFGQLAYRDYGFDWFGEQTVNYKAPSYDLGAGFEFNRYLAAELGVRIVRNADETYFDEPTVSNLVDTLDASNFINLSAVGSLPLGDIFSLYARAGFVKWKLESQVVQNDLDDFFSAVIYQSEDDGTDLFYGAGVGISVDNGLVRLEYQAAKLGDIKTSYVTLGLVWRFAIFD